MLAVVDALRLERPLLVGHSLGAAVSVHAAAASSARFSGLALVDYAAEIAPSSMKLVRAVLAMMHGTYASVADYAAILKRRHVLANPQLLDTIAGAALQAADGGHRPRFDPAVLDALGECDSRSTKERLAQLFLPVLVVRGALSSMVSQQGARELADACPSAQLAVVPMAGHSAQIDNPQGLLKALGLLREPSLAAR